MGASSAAVLPVQARELKSVQLDVAAGGVRLLFHAPHPNRFNTNKQARASCGI